MNAMDLDRVFGRSRLRMVTGAHVEVFREEAAPGERRRYTKRFLATPDGDFRLWTEREWRLLARLMGHGVAHVPDVVQFDRGAPDRPALVQTYDAGITVDHWATLLPLARDGIVHAHVFEDCAHWWALARHALVALDAIHALDVVHLDLKADNVCIPYAPADADPMLAPQATFGPRFEQLALIDFAFSLVSGEALLQALPIARQPDYAYQSPRLLQALEAGARGDLAPTQRLDWRCDLYSLAAMLRRYLPDPEQPMRGAWNHARHAQARALVRELIAAHDADLAPARPHRRWIGEIGRMLEEPEFAASLARGWSLAWTPDVARDALPTPITRIALPVPRERRSPVGSHAAGARLATPHFDAPSLATPSPEPLIAVDADARHVPPLRERRRAWPVVLLGCAALAGAFAAPYALDAWRAAVAPAPTVQRTARVETPPSPAPMAPMKASNSADAAPSAAAVNALPPVAQAAVPANVAPPVVPQTVPVASSTQPHIADATSAPTAATRAPTTATATGRRAAPHEVASTVHVAPSTASRVAVAKTARVAGVPAGRVAAAPASRVALAAASRTAVATSARGRSPMIVARGSRPATTFAHTTVGSSAGAHAPAPASLLRPALPPRILAMLAAAQLSSSGARPSGTTSTPAPPSTAAAPTSISAPAPVAAPTPTPFPAPAMAPSLPSSIQRTSFEPVDYGARAQEVLAAHVPRVAQRAERLAARALFLADHAEDEGQLVDVLRAAEGVGLQPQDPLASWHTAPAEARSLSDASRNAAARRAGSNEALEYQLRAFGANPLDAAVAGHLAALQLQRRPIDVMAARSLALHALAVHDGANPGGRIEDWSTLAVANALAGRDREARAAWLVTLALAPTAERACRAAMDAYATWGERVRGSVEALVYRAHQWNRAARSPACEWPPRHMAGLVPLQR